METSSLAPTAPFADPYPLFHLSRLDFPLTFLPDLPSHQLALVALREDATAEQKGEAKELFMARREAECARGKRVGENEEMAKKAGEGGRGREGGDEAGVKQMEGVKRASADEEGAPAGQLQPIEDDSPTSGKDTVSTRLSFDMSAVVKTNPATVPTALRKQLHFISIKGLPSSTPPVDFLDFLFRPPFSPFPRPLGLRHSKKGGWFVAFGSIKEAEQVVKGLDGKLFSSSTDPSFSSARLVVKTCSPDSALTWSHLSKEVQKSGRTRTSFLSPLSSKASLPAVQERTPPPSPSATSAPTNTTSSRLPPPQPQVAPSPGKKTLLPPSLALSRPTSSRTTGPLTSDSSRNVSSLRRVPRTG